MTWPTVPLKWLAFVVPGQAPPSDAVNDFAGEGLPFLQGNAEFGEHHPAPIHRCDVPSKRSGAGEILVSVRAPVGALNMSDRSYGIGRGLVAVRPGPQLDGRYCWWWMHSAVDELRAKATGSTYDAVTAADLGSLRVPSTSLATQRAMADFLDAETARIDALIAKKRQLISVLDERVSESFVERACGYSPVPLRRTLVGICDGPFGSAFASSDYSTTGAFVVRLGNIGFAEFRPDVTAFIPERLYSTFLRHRVRKGDLLIAGLGDDRNHAGRACVAPDLGPAIVKGKCFCARVRPDMADAAFLALTLSSSLGAQALVAATRGSTRSMLNLDLVKSLPVALPPLDTQRAVVARIEEERACVQLTVDRLTRQISLLRERRQVLITAAVTGELAVPGVAA